MFSLLVQGTIWGPTAMHGGSRKLRTDNGWDEERIYGKTLRTEQPPKKIYGKVFAEW